MRVVNGKREWLVAWTPTDEGETFNNSWEPTKNVGQPLIDDFWARQKRQLQKSVDVSPLDERVPETIATRVLTSYLPLAQNCDFGGAAYLVGLPPQANQALVSST